MDSFDIAIIAAIGIGLYLALGGENVKKSIEGVQQAAQGTSSVISSAGAFVNKTGTATSGAIDLYGDYVFPPTAFARTTKQLYDNLRAYV